MELWTQLKPQDPPFAHIPYVAGSQADMEHDAACAHALVRAIREWWDKPDDGQIADGAVSEVERRAAELMREWGFEGKVAP